MRRLAATVLAGAGALSAVLGIAALVVLSSVYRPAEIALTESPASFLAWLGHERDLATPGTMNVLAPRIASRLLLMPLDRRRALALDLMAPEYWSPLLRKGETARPIETAMREGILLALRRSPAAGDLYLAAAALDARIEGFDERALGYFRASRIFAPRELPVLRARLALGATVWGLLEDDDRAGLRSDFALLEHHAPRQAEALKRLFTAAGVTFE